MEVRPISGRVQDLFPQLQHCCCISILWRAADCHRGQSCFSPHLHWNIHTFPVRK